MATARANRQHWLSPAGRSFWTSPVSGLLLFLLLLGGPATWLPRAHEQLSTPAQNESEPEDTDADETATPIAPSVGVPRSRKTKGGVSPTPSNASLLLLKAGALPHSRLLISALSVGAFAKRNGAGISMRC
jgi:hypothetical protein